jgi:hypothetical protein
MDKFEKEYEACETEMLYILKEYLGSDSMDSLVMSMTNTLMTILEDAKKATGHTLVKKMLEKEASAERAEELIRHAELVYRAAMIRALAITISTAHYRTFGKNISVTEALKNFADMSLAAYLASNELSEHTKVDSQIVAIPVTGGNKDSN